VHGPTFRNCAIRYMLSVAYYLDPLNVFLYTWQFLPTLAIEESNNNMSEIYHWYRKISVWILPAAFVGIYVGLAVAVGK
jgi:hypothetical protein